ncbi:lysylphosphatidylglycerol synthase transmembrane domain-containing protein [Pararhodonellum marinum]|uniref:lysylphosphatidylglycerol synthase transmembrane domain-containing protein n=1 Tax=Pararhodonellum marinum TaxID=2755358 RepID=UPI00188F2DCB|nr:lysylphosphatidylglycerol synthase transmembrane domain-containing protein [Pararhodonellum marinum]
MKRKSIKLILKLSLTGLALYVVFRNIDLQETWGVIKSLNPTWMILAILFFVLSKVFTALRLNSYFRDIDIQMPEVQNFKLYWVGMFYNLFLPGGIGGDGYKAYWVNKAFQKPLKKILAAILLDRISGLVAILFLIFIFFFWVEIAIPWLAESWVSIAVGLLLVALPCVFWWSIKWFFPSFISSFWRSGLYSLAGQLAQLVTAYFIMLSIGITELVLSYQFVFLVSSLVSVLPLTIGGVGARELVFVLSHDLMGIDKNAAVAFSLLFFLISAAVSLCGAFVDLKGMENKY